MKSMLTDKAQDAIERIVTWTRLVGYIVIVYALAQHLPAVEALGVTFAGIEILRAVRGRAPEESEESEQ